jgi:anti-sigma regulatory factor (Ser/Thr protein kinase)
MARAAVAELCAAAREDGRALPASLSGSLLLLVSEVVTNAVLHSKSPPGAQLVLKAKVRGGAIRVSVTDSGHGFTDETRRHAGGYGLYLVDQLASHWGVEQTDQPAARTTVWFELSPAEAV